MKSKPYTKLKIFIEAEAILSAVALFVFFIFSLISWQISSGDFLSNKYHSAASASLFSQRIYGPPIAPVVSLGTSCDGTTPRVAVDWGEDEDATTFDVYRNGSVLVTGLTSTSYYDNNVDVSTAYLYYVIAHGPAGDTTSAIESVTTSDCGTGVEEQEISVITFDGENVQNPNVEYDTTNRRPQITGTTTIENALIDIQLYGASTSFAVTTANATGYWHWTPVSNLSYGDYVMYLTATNPSNTAQTASRVFVFEIEREEDDDDEDEDDGGDVTSQVIPGGAVPVDVEPSPGETTQKPQAEKPLNFSLVVINEGGKVSGGEDLKLRLVVLDVAKNFEGKKAKLNISIVDSLEQELSRDSFDLRLYSGQKLEKKIKIPCPEKEGEYIIRAEILVDQQRISKEEIAHVSRGDDCPEGETGLIAAGSTLESICTFTDWLGWIVIALFLLLLILIILFLILTRRDREEEEDTRKVKKKTAR